MLSMTIYNDIMRAGDYRCCDNSGEQTTQVRLLQEWSRRLGVTVASGLLLVAGVKRKAWRHTGGQTSTGPRLRPPSLSRRSAPPHARVTGGRRLAPSPADRCRSLLMNGRRPRWWQVRRAALSGRPPPI